MSEDYEGFRHDPSWGSRPPAQYMAATITDLRRLEPALQEAAELVDVGEASWPSHLVSSAINGLADLGLPLRALVSVPRDARGRTIAVKQLAIAEENYVEATRRRLLEAVRLLEPDERGTVMWQESH